MTDRYRLTDAPPSTAPASKARGKVSTGHRALRIVLWMLMLPAAGFNVASSGAGQTGLSLVGGIVATGCIVGLITSYVMGRRR